MARKTHGKVIQLESSREAVKMRWVKHEQASVRAYECCQRGEPRFCVSTQSSELVCVLEGEVTITMGPASQTLVIGPSGHGVIFLATPHTFHMTPGTKLFVVDIPPSRAPGLGLGRFDHQIRGRLEKQLGKLWEHMDQVSSLELAELARTFAEESRRSHPVGMEHAHSTGRMVAIKEHIEHSRLHPVSLATLAQTAGLDRFYLARHFKRSFGASPRDYLQFLRMEHVTWAMLEQDGSNLTQRANESGFGDYATFCRRMRQRFGCPPSGLVTARVG